MSDDVFSLLEELMREVGEVLDLDESDVHYGDETAADSAVWATEEHGYESTDYGYDAYDEGSEPVSELTSDVEPANGEGYDQPPTNSDVVAGSSGVDIVPDSGEGESVEVTQASPGIEYDTTGTYMDATWGYNPTTGIYYDSLTGEMYDPVFGWSDEYDAEAISSGATAIPFEGDMSMPVGPIDYAASTPLNPAPSYEAVEWTYNQPFETLYDPITEWTSNYTAVGYGDSPVQEPVAAWAAPSESWDINGSTATDEIRYLSYGYPQPATSVDTAALGLVWDPASARFVTATPLPSDPLVIGGLPPGLAESIGSWSPPNVYNTGVPYPNAGPIYTPQPYTDPWYGVPNPGSPVPTPSLNDIYHGEMISSGNQGSPYYNPYTGV